MLIMAFNVVFANIQAKVLYAPYFWPFLEINPQVWQPIYPNSLDTNHPINFSNVLYKPIHWQEKFRIFFFKITLIRGLYISRNAIKGQNQLFVFFNNACILDTMLLSCFLFWPVYELRGYQSISQGKFLGILSSISTFKCIGGKILGFHVQNIPKNFVKLESKGTQAYVSAKPPQKA